MIGLLKKLDEKVKDRKEEKKALKRAGYNKLVPKSGYTFTPSFIKAGNRYGTIVRITNLYGHNRNRSFGWFVNFIPEITISGVRGWLISSDKAISQEDQSELMRKKITPAINTYSNGTDLGNKPNASIKEKNNMRVVDLTRASILDGRSNLIINNKIVILLTSNNPDAISRQIDRLQELYKDNSLVGIELYSVAGEQPNLLQNLFTPPKMGLDEFTFMSSDFAGNEHIIRRGINDKKGVSIGKLRDSYNSGRVMMDLDGTFRNKILVASHKSSTVNGYQKSKMPASSLWGQKIANQAMARGHRTFHLVLNNFQYFADSQKSTYSCDLSMNEVLEKVRIVNGGVNPLEMFGDLSNASSIPTIYSNRLTLLGKMLYYASDRTLTAKAQEGLKKALDEFFHRRGLWDKDVVEFPELAKTINIKDHENYVVFSDLIMALNNEMGSARNSGNHNEAERYSDLITVLQNILNAYPAMFNSRSTLPNLDNPDKLQIYFEFDELSLNPNIMEAQFLNTFDFAVNSAKENDIVMIHGIDKLSIETLELILPKLDFLEREGVRLAYLFDTIDSKDSEKANSIERAGIFNTDKILYDDFGEDFDYTFIGSMSNSELEQYEKKVKQKLDGKLRAMLTSGEKFQYQVRRPEDLTSNIIDADFIL